MHRLASSSRSALAVAAIAIGLQLGSVAAAWAQAAAPRAAAPVASVDPVDAAVAEGSRRFGVPEHWIRAVMRQESNGEVAAVSSAGAMGLMQVMPGTYAELRVRYSLGGDPFAIRDNILAGTAYLREMHDRYGGLGMLAAYNAGPGRWEDYRAGIRPLPRETIGYLARLGPVLNVGTLPAESTTSIPATPSSPFAAPIFVVLSRQAETTSATNVPAHPRIVLASKSATPPASNTLFVRRSSMGSTAADAQPNEQPSASERAAEPQPPAASRRVEQLADSLFPPRTGGDRQ